MSAATGVEAALETGWLASTPLDDNVVRQFLRNQAEVNELVASARGGASALVDGGALADSGTAVPYFNQLLLERPLSDAGDVVLDECDRFFTGAGRPVTLLSAWPTPDLQTRGWTLVGHPAFVLRGPAPQAPVERVGIETVLVRTGSELAIAERIAVEGYPIDEARGLPAGCVFAQQLVATPLRVRLGSLDGVPVAVGNSHVAHGVVNLCLGATLPAARRRGVWEALVRARVDDAPHLPAVAYTSDLSRPGFIRMGFLPILRFTLWAKPYA
jgi:hypothetical protein